MQIYENELRDLLGDQIEILESGLILLDKETFIPNTFGTRGFIDLLAQDAGGHYVIIELKRSDASAREAIHEVLKYVEGVKGYLGVKEEEIRVFIVSTTWNELLVPFSRFVDDSKLSVTGFRIEVLDTKKIESTIIQPIRIDKGRFIAPWHELNLYMDEISLEKGIREYERSCEQKGISDYVLVILDAPDNFNEVSKANIRESLAQIKSQFGQEPYQEEEIKSILEKVDDYHFMLYFGMQILTRDRYLEIISSDSIRYDEIIEFIADMDNEEALCWLHESACDIGARPHSDDFQIGYPAKFKTLLLEDQGWNIRAVKRFGTFARNQLLSDIDIIEELKGSEGSTGQGLKRRIQTNNIAHLSSAKAAIEKCLKDNPVWSIHILRELDEITAEYPNSEIDLHVFNPCAGVMTLYLAMSQGAIYVPNYFIKVFEGENTRRMYYGCLVNIGAGLRLQQIVKKYYHGHIFGLLLTLTWGGYEPQDTVILEDLGLVYRSFRCDANGDERSYFVLRDERWRPSEPVDPLSTVFEFLSNNPDLVSDLELEIGTRWDGSIIADESVGEHQLKEMVNIEEGVKRGVYWLSDVFRCDICKHDFENDTYIVDGGTKMGSDALMCSNCFTKYSIGIGWGLGQIYMRSENKWLQVGGFRS